MEKSCGAVIFTRTNTGVRYVLVESLEGKWGFPKGHMEGSETEKETALREIKEEIGIIPEFISDFRQVNEYMLPGTQILKQVVFFLGEYRDQTPRHQKEELKSCRLVSYDEALTLLSHESLKQVLQNAEQVLNCSC